MRIYTRELIEEIIREGLSLPGDHPLFFSKTGMVFVPEEGDVINAVSCIDATPIPGVAESDNGTNAMER